MTATVKNVVIVRPYSVTIELKILNSTYYYGGKGGNDVLRIIQAMD